MQSQSKQSMAQKKVGNSLWFGSFEWSLTTHNVVNDGIDSRIEVAKPVRDERRCHREVVYWNPVSATIGKK